MVSHGNDTAATAGKGLADQAYRALLARLRDGRLRSSSFLSVPMLVEELAMPIAVVREAVKRADAVGLLSILPKRGILIMDAGPEMTRECLELRAMFEVEAARKLIHGGRDLPIAELRREHEELLRTARQGTSSALSGRALRTDLSLHDALAKGLGNGLAARLYAENRDRICVIQNTRTFLPARIVSAVEEHLRIIIALEAGDTEATGQAIREHLQNTLKWWGV